MTDFGKFILGGAAILAGVAGLGYAESSMMNRNRQTKQAINENTSKIVREYVNQHPIDIPAHVVDSAINDAVYKQVKLHTDRAANDIRSKAFAKINSEVDSVMKENRDAYSEKIASRLSKLLDRNDLKDEVVEEVREKFMDKLDGMIDETVSEYVEEKGEKIIKDRTDAHLRGKSFFTW